MTATSGRLVAVWRWYDAVVVAAAPGGVRVCEPAHGEVDARLRPGSPQPAIGTGAWASAGLRGADWWVAGPATPAARIREDEAEAIEALYSTAGFWEATLSG